MDFAVLWCCCALVDCGGNSLFIVVGVVDCYYVIFNLVLLTFSVLGCLHGYIVVTWICLRIPGLICLGEIVDFYGCGLDVY